MKVLFLVVILILFSGIAAYQFLRKEPSPNFHPEINNGQTCIVSGCSGQVCAEEEVITTCEYNAVYACFKNARCEQQSSGECGWTETPEFKQCVENIK